MKTFEGLFGCYTIRTQADNKEQARPLILKKFDSYKDGSTKKEYIRPKINTEFGIIEVRMRLDGYFVEV